jgi:acyl carrier protein
MEQAEIKAKTKTYILDQFLPGESPDALTDSTPLISGGILDSISTLKLVSFLEEQFGINLEAHEVDAEHLDTLDKVAALVTGKKSPA